MGAAGWAQSNLFYFGGMFGSEYYLETNRGPGCPLATFYSISKYQSSSLCGGMAAEDCIRNSANMSGVYVHKEAIILVKRYVNGSLK